jgi:hypothetical protein
MKPRSQKLAMARRERKIKKRLNQLISDTSLVPSRRDVVFSFVSSFAPWNACPVEFPPLGGTPLWGIPQGGPIPLGSAERKK